MKCVTKCIYTHLSILRWQRLDTVKPPLTRFNYIFWHENCYNFGFVLSNSSSSNVLNETFLVILNHCVSWSNDRKRVSPCQCNLEIRSPKKELW